MSNEFIYHIMTDRFFPSGKEDSNGNWKGGNFRDVINHLDYIQKLGASGIMLTPFYKNAAYHGYHVVDFEQIDAHFGTESDLRELIDETHRRGMIIVADFVANHCHKSCRLFADGKHKSWFKFKKNGTYKSFAGIADLPMFDTDNQEVRNYLTKRMLVLCRLGFDAIRLDHATGPSYAFWKHARHEVKRIYPRVRLVGEVWGQMDFKPQSTLRYFTNVLRFGTQEARQLEYVDVFDGVLDFRYQQMLCRTVRKEKSIIRNSKLHKQMRLHLARYPTNFQLWLFLDNHDLNRFLFECGGDKGLLKEGLNFSRQWGMPSLMFYGTEKEITNTVSIFDGTPYADERVRMCLK